MFVKDVIYGLKKEYGRSVSFTNLTSQTLNTLTGIKTPVPSSFTINKVIVPPLSITQEFLRQLGMQKEGHISAKQLAVYVDTGDIPSGQSISEATKFTVNSKTYQISNIIDYLDCAKILIGTLA